jgi:uncharacterized repeat protein (TIGR02543 family)
LTSEKTYTLTLENLNLTYVITYHLWDEEVEFGYYQYADAALTLTSPFRQDYAFRGWYADADLSGDPVTQIPAGSTGDRGFYAKWIEAEQTPADLSLAESLAWISANAEEGGAYTITVRADETIEPTMLYYDDKKVDIILKGDAEERTVSLGSNGSLFTVNSGVTLTLGNNLTVQGRSGNTAPLVRVNAGGALSVGAGAKISGNKNTAASTYGGGVQVNGGTFTLSGGEISGNSASNGGGGVYVSSGTFTMNGGEIRDNSVSSWGGGVYVDSSGTFTLSGGEISGNSASNGGGGVYVYSSGTFTLSDGEISGNSAYYGGGVQVNGGTFTMSGGAISGNRSTSSDSDYGGGGVYVDGDYFSSGTFTMSGGEISGNTASSNGGGVQVSSGTFTQCGGEIRGNTAASNGGGVYVGGDYFSSGTFTKQSGGAIYGSNAGDALKNTATSGDGHTAYVSSGPKIRNTTAGIGVTLNSSVSGLPGGWETALPSDLSLAQSLTWISANAEEGGAYTITISANETIAPQTLSYSGKNVTITLRGDASERTVSLNTNGALFTVESGVTLMMGNNVTMQGRSSNTAPLTRVNAGGTLMMNSGSKIIGNRNTGSSGGGVVVNSSGTFTLNGGAVSGNSASSGGGVYVDSGGAWIMNGGSVSGNTSAYDGGGASLYGTFTMNGGAISGNTATSGYGGGVYADSGGVFTKQSGGTIYGSNADTDLKNTASNGDSYGHAVYVNDSLSKLRNGTAGEGVTLDGSASGAAGGWETPLPTNLSLAQSLTWLTANAVQGGAYTIMLSAHETIAPQTLFYSGKTVDIIINGGAAERTVGLSSTGSLFTVGNGVTLTLGNNVTVQGRSDNTAPLAQVNDGGALVMESGSKAGGNVNTDSNGGGVQVSSGGTFIKRSGGVVYGADAESALQNTAANGDSYGHAVYVEGSPAKIRNTTAGDGLTLDSSKSGAAGGWESAVLSGLSLEESLTWVSANAVGGGNYTIALNRDESIAPTTLSYSGKTVSLTLNGGATKRAISLSSTGYIFTVGSGVTLTLGNNVTLQGRSDNTAPLVQVNSGGTLVMNSGSKITGNTTTSYGGGVYVSSSGTFTMNGGEISGNTASYGGGVYVSSSGTFTMSGGAISGNTARDYGGGVYVYSGTFTKQSGGTIYGRYDSSGANEDGALRNTASNGDSYGHAVYVDYGSKKRNTTAGIGVTLDSGTSGADGGWVDPMPTESLQGALTWLASNAEEGGNYTITLNGDESIAPTTLSYSGKTISLTLQGGATERVISLSSTGSLFTVGSGVTLTLGNNVTVQGRSDNTASLVQVNSGGTLVMESGSKITGNTASYDGGGGVYSSGTFTMDGGEISGNTASYGGGVYVSSGTFTMSGGAISGNTASSYYGGGVYVNDYGTFTMSDGEIRGNTASEYGGGVYASSGTFTKQSGGTIYGSNADTDLKNTASNGDSYGHAVYVSSSKKRNTTAGIGVTLDSGTSGAAGGWVDQYTVTFYADGGSPDTQTLTVNDGDSVGYVNIPTEPSRSGYTFSGWWTSNGGGGSQFTYSTTVSTNITVYAKWTAQYTVTFDADGGSPDTQTLTVNDGDFLGIIYSSVSGGTWALLGDSRRQSPAIGHGEVTKARVSFTSTVADASITIQLDVSSESGCDYAFISTSCYAEVKFSPNMALYLA